MNKLKLHTITTGELEEMLVLSSIQEYNVHSTYVTVKFKPGKEKEKKDKKKNSILDSIRGDDRIRKTLTFTYSEVNDNWMLTGVKESSY